MKKQQITTGLAHYPGCGFRRYPKKGFVISFLYTFRFIRQYASDTTKDATFDDRNSIYALHESIINMFWNDYYLRLSYIENSKSSSNEIFNNAVIQLLINEKIKHNCVFSDTNLIDLQTQIEDLTMMFDEGNIYNSTPNMIKLLINKDLPNAKEYLYSNLPSHYYPMIKFFGTYTLEALMIHVLGLVFNPIREASLVRVSTLLDRLNSTVQDHARFISPGSGKVDAVHTSKDKSDKDVVMPYSKKERNKKDKIDYAIGIHLIHFMVERNLIRLSTDEGVTYEDAAVLFYKGKAYIKKYLYVICNFELRLLPIKLNLPMVCRPLDWQPAKRGSDPEMLSDLIGGYLCKPSGDFYNMFRLLTTHNINHLFIKLNKTEYTRMCKIMNRLQSQAFEINKKTLRFIEMNRQCLEEKGLLMPKALAGVNPIEASIILRDLYASNVNDIQKASSYNDLLNTLYKRVQRARYEDFVITLASAYEGYQIYLPAFMDFRGRIYRSGVLHFHERDLAKSLLVFSGHPQPQAQNNLSENTLSQDLACAAAFKYKNFSNLDDALKWYNEHQRKMFASDESFIQLAAQASNPFQFLVMILSQDDVSHYHQVPVTQDASSSAYQIMSYLLLNLEMGRRTNLLPSEDGKIKDVYMCLQDELKKFLNTRYHDSTQPLLNIIHSFLTRKIVKGLFMPLVYGKTVYSMAQDIRNTEKGSLLTAKQSYELAVHCFHFWCNKHPDIVNLMNLLNLIAWFCSKMDKPVLFSTPYITTVQDYMRNQDAYIWLYDRMTKKRHRVTLRIPTETRDTRKTQISTCANFIHQKDAYIAIQVVEDLIRIAGEAPVYTVHDNFITTVLYARYIPQIYTGVFVNIGAPLKIINDYIHQNLLTPQLYTPEDKASDARFIEEQLSKDPSTYSFHGIEGPIPSETLRSILKSHMPKDLSKAESALWRKKIASTVSCYESYCQTVCGGAHFQNPEDAGKRHAEKWNEFKAELERWDNIGFNYSVHY